MPESVTLVGSGNWGCAIARIVGRNVLKYPEFNQEVKMWVFEEMVDGRKLSEIINTTHINVKYLPGAALPSNIVAVPDLGEAVNGATLLIFVLPHQFLPKLLPQIKPRMGPNCRAISLIKGIDFDANGLVLISDTIRKGLQIDVSVLMGANVADEVAQDQFCEATIGYTNRGNGALFQKLFNAPTFLVSIVEDAAAVELCGALKNVVALGAGFCDGLKLGNNTKASIIRLGLLEMIKFCQVVYGGAKVSTFFESCGVADLITTCYGGRNRKCAAAFVESGKSWEVLEKEMLGGQKLQGTLTAKEVYEVLRRRNLLAEFPLFALIYRISFEGLPARRMFDVANAKL